MVNQSGLINYTNIKSGQPIAVTWGVFPGQEIVQVLISKMSIRIDKIGFDEDEDEGPQE